MTSAGSRSFWKRRLYAVTVASLTICSPSAGPASAETLNVASAADATTMDPHSQATLSTQQLLAQIYEPLVGRGTKLELVPALALKWEQVEPERWRFSLRQDVKFHDGSSFTADDVSFSLRRAALPSSNYKNYVDTIDHVEVGGPHEVDVVTRGPDPVLPDKIARIAILSRAWAEKNNAQEPQTPKASEETFATRNANGTGPFKLVERNPGVRTVLQAFDGWQGGQAGNVTEYISTPITSAATRVAALVSGSVDIVVDPPLQDLPRLKADAGTTVVTGPENRTMLLVLDQGRDQLLYSSVKGKNPFKDIRVRKALYQSIDADSIAKRIMRGYAIPAGILFPPGIKGYAADLDTRLAYDPDAARRLLAEAGYPDGFEFTLDCPSNRYQNDEAVCQAVVAMWAKIGVNATLRASPVQAYLPRVLGKDASMTLVGIGSPSLDAYFSFQANLLSRPGEASDGQYSLGFSNQRINELATLFQKEIDQTKRHNLIRQGLEIYKDEIANIPLYHSVGAWAMRKNVHTTYRSDGLLEARYVTVE